jgi:hypothetical protein
MKKRTKPQGRKNEVGNAILLVLFAFVIITPLVGTAFEFTENRGLHANRTSRRDIAEAACHGVMEYAYGKWRGWIQANGGRIPTVAECSGTSPDIGISTLEAQSILSGSEQFAGAVLTDLTITPIDPLGQPISGSLTADEQKAAMLVRKPLETFIRRIGRAYSYEVSARVFVPAAKGDTGAAIKARESSNTSLSVLSDTTRYVEAAMARYFTKSDAPIWQAMMFFEGDLELFPTPEMTLYGWIHSNSNHYISHAKNNNELRMLSDFTFFGSPGTIKKGPNSVIKDPDGIIYGVSYWVEENENHWKDWKEPIWAGGGYDAQVSRVNAPIDPLPVDRATAINTTDNNPNNDSFREIIERPVDTNGDGKRTAADDTPAFADRRYYNVADLKIIINRAAPNKNDRIKILDKNDVRISGTLADAIANNVLGKNSTTGLPKTKELYDYREAGNITSPSSSAAQKDSGKVTLTDINISQLTPLLNGMNGYNGVVYFKDETPMGTEGVNDKRAARLVRGGVLPDKGMTFVTEDGVYIQGDYNTGSEWSGNITASDADGTLSKQPPTNTVGTVTMDTSNVVAGYTEKPAAVCADAVMFLSNAWSDNYNHQTTTTNRTAARTTYNTAFMSGDVPTDTTGNVNRRSGGGINFPRVLENWDGKTLTYHGSMVQMFTSQMFNGSWNHNIYRAPIRPWFFNDDFINNPPPGPLEFVEYGRGRLVRK